MEAYDLSRVADDNPNGELVIDCGPLEEESARDRADLLFAFGIGKKSMFWGPSTGSPRIFFQIHKSKHNKVLESFPLVEKPWFWGSTHRFSDSIGKAP